MPLQTKHCSRQAVVHDFKAARTIGLNVWKLMDARPSAIDSCFQSETVFCETTKIPRQAICISTDFMQLVEFVYLPIVPEHCLAKRQPQWHLVYKGFECARTFAGAGKIRMAPGPELAMPVSTVVSLNAETQRVSCKTPSIQRDRARKKRIGMRRSRESYPSLIAQRIAKCRTIIQIPRNRVSLGVQCSPAGALADFIVADSEVEWILASFTEV